ncbi:hypothetical protein [[Limnothrix rosea] IAM M-220]|uniref:hypothetical protein n=1 Tax=[Limnothrix rosea] IAM M-220 TaxID=454133 RepID=UPI00111559C7|nr:hypothetical protein [[Limnothrix rosea] IAM M-220]
MVTANFPRNLQQIFELTQESTILLIIIALNEAPTLAKKTCQSLKKHPQTKHTPIVLVQYKSPLEKQQLADAYLPRDFNLQDFNQIMRQLTIGY